MVFLQRKRPPQPPPPPSPPNPPPRAPRATRTATPDDASSSSAVDDAAALLAEAGCTLLVPLHQPPALPSPLSFAPRLARALAAADAALRDRLLAGLAAFAESPARLRQLLLPTSAAHSPSLARALLSVPALQPGLLGLLLDKLPEHFDNVLDGMPLHDDVGRLIVAQFRWLDFLVDADAFVAKLMEVLSVAPPRLKKEIIGSLPEIIGDQCHATVVAALEKLLQEDSEVVVSALDALSDLNLSEQLQEQAVTVAISCIRTVHADQMPHLLRFLLLSATPFNAGRIISQIRKQLKFVSTVDPRAARGKKLKGKASANGTDGAILDALRSGLRFKNMLCEAFLKELKSVDNPRDHKVIDVWLIMLIYGNGGALQKSAEKILKSKILQLCIRETLFDQCIRGNTELVKDHFVSYLSVSDFLLACKEEKAREFAAYLFTALFEEFSDTFSRQELIGSLIAHIGSGVSLEVSSALDIMISLTSDKPEELIPLSSHITGILDYLESFHEDNLRKVYEIFCHLALAAGFNTGSGGSSVANELLMVVRKQVSNPDMKYRRMGIIGALRIVSTIADVNASMNCSSSQQPNYDEALELLKMAVNSCKFVMLPLILLYDELAVLLENSSLHSAIVEWVGEHVAEFDTVFLADLDDGELSKKYVCDGIEGELWMNLDGNISPVFQTCLQILPSQFSLLTIIERLGNQGSLGGINAVLGCPLHLPSTKLNAFSTQVATRVDNVSQRARNETAVKLLMRLRNLILLEGLLNAYLKIHPLSLPDLRYVGDHGSTSTSKFNLPKNMGDQNMEGNVSNKRQKGHKDKASSEKSNSDEKFKQPTILDAFKRAGVTISQETNRDSQPSPSGMMSRVTEHETNNPCKFGIVDLMAAPAQLDMQRFKFRTLHATCLSLLNYSEPQDTTVSYNESEMPLYVYLLRELQNKLDNLYPSSKPFFSSSQGKSTQAYCQKSMEEFLNKIQPLFSSVRKHLDGAVSMIKDGSDSCPDNWNSHSASAGNPDIPYVVVLKSSVATSVFKEVLGCYRKLLGIPDLLNQANISVLKELLQTFQPSENFDEVLAEFRPSLVPSNLDYLYCGAYTMFAAILDIVLNSVIMLFEKSGEQNGKNLHMGCSKEIIPFLRKHLGLSARKLLTSDLPSEDAENGWQSKGDLIQKILQIYLKNSDSTSDLLDELACSVLPKVPSFKTGSTQDMSHGFPTLCASTILSWYRVVHEENTGNLNKMIKQALKTKAQSERAVETSLEEIQKSVLVFVSLINMCKTHEKVVMHAMAVKHGGRFVDTFLKAFNFLETHFGQHNDIILQMIKSLQKATKTIQTICAEAKGHKRTMITSKIPVAKRSLERFVFQVKALLHNCSTEETFWMGTYILCTPNFCSWQRREIYIDGRHCCSNLLNRCMTGNLRHKDLQGQLVSSQVYGSVDDSPNDEQEQMETDPETPADENANAMDEDAAEDSNEAPLEE
ncbi:Os07g0154400 [Oryza sativa Japonica Group]|uniref:Os07g0154400 protein n=1 Tax=Oryza sativa subsp. japonica TaxID=39947 RepID=Q0D8J4_ORYSJ|nr:Os07g0154400 [Oryza sativa Japonica Group]|eukprot:NP_001058915.2 Os07g0154400 [Oryza sativa Japonica Group]